MNPYCTMNHKKAQKFSKEVPNLFQDLMIEIARRKKI
jgi:hypothetical protein